MVSGGCANTAGFDRCSSPTGLRRFREDVSAATSEWGKVLGEDDPDKVLPLYADDAVLWGTLSPTVRADQARAPKQLTETTCPWPLSPQTAR